MRRFPLISLLFLLALPLRAQEADDNTFGGWEFIELNHDFGRSPVFASFYFEHDNFQYRHLDCWYTRTTVGEKILPWLKADVAYDFLQEPSGHTHKALLDLTGTLTQGNLKVSIRERYVHSWTPALGAQGNVLRSRLKVQYAIEGSRFSPYLAVEVFTWGSENYDITRRMQLEAYYLYYAFSTREAQHVLGIGLNFYLQA